jgi:hypothetical protein
MSMQSHKFPDAPYDIEEMELFLCSKNAGDWTGQAMLVETGKVME